MRRIDASIEKCGRIADSNGSRLGHRAIEGHGAVEVGDDAKQYRTVLRKSVWVVGGHHTASAQLSGVNFYFTEPQVLPFPLALGQAFDSADEDVGAKTAAVKANRRDSAIGCDQQGKHVEAFGSRHANQLN